MKRKSRREIVSAFNDFSREKRLYIWSSTFVCRVTGPFWKELSTSRRFDPFNENVLPLHRIHEVTRVTGIDPMAASRVPIQIYRLEPRTETVKAKIDRILISILNWMGYMSASFKSELSLKFDYFFYLQLTKC